MRNFWYVLGHFFIDFVVGRQQDNILYNVEGGRGEGRER